jgi:hypothetical protein
MLHAAHQSKQPVALRTVAASLTLALCLIQTSFSQQDDAAKAEFEAIVSADTMIMVPMGDGVGLATDVYRPKTEEYPE